MKMTKSSYFPENAIFWGAGATYTLGFPTTGQQGELIIAIAKAEKVEDYKKGLLKLDYFDNEALAEFSELLFILDDIKSEDNKADKFNCREYNQEQLEVAKDLFKDVAIDDIESLLRNLRTDYDIGALKEIIKICPQDKTSVVMDTFNLIDYHYLNSEGFYTNDEVLLCNNRLKAARNAIIMIIQTTMTLAYLKGLSDKQHIHAIFRKFAKDLTTYAYEDSKRKKDLDYQEKEFYLLPFYFISLNWDHYLTWLIFQANKEFNDGSVSIGGVNKKLKFFNDLSIRLGLRHLGKSPNTELTNKIWYPYNETVVQRVNDSDYGNNRIVRIGKFFFPHGSLALRACPSCGGLIGSFGDTWDFDSTSLFPPSLIPSSRKIAMRTVKEKEWVEKGHYDAMECVHCGVMTSVKESLMIMQTIMKGDYQPSLKIIQAEINAYLMHSNHIIFMGYSLPKDDLIWKSILLARKARNKDIKITVIIGYQGSKKWQYAKTLDELNEEDNSQYQSFFDIFKGCEMRFFTGGIPAIFDVYSVKEILEYR